MKAHGLQIVKTHGLQIVKTHGLQVCGAASPPLYYQISFFERSRLCGIIYFCSGFAENIFSQPIDTRRIIVYNINSDNNYRY